MTQRVDTIQQQLALAKEAVERKETGQTDCTPSVLISVQVVWEVDHLQPQFRGRMELPSMQTLPVSNQGNR
eukprot:9677046-Prorocentrum_lima.AAC.1